MGESGRDFQQDLRNEFESDQRMRKEFEQAVKAGDQPSWNALNWLKECDDPLPVKVAEAVYKLAPSAFDFEGDPAPLTYRNAVRTIPRKQEKRGKSNDTKRKT
jgi:hypothetical protein